MTKLTAIRGGGEKVPPPRPCVICGVPCRVPRRYGCGVLAGHLAWRRLRGDTAATRYSTERGILLLSDYLYGVLGVAVLGAIPEHLAAWQAQLDMSAGSIANYTARARVFYRWALDDGLIEADPSLRLPVPRTGRRLPRPIDGEELFWAIRNAPQRVRPWLVLAAFAGLRAREVAYLKRQEIMETAPQPVLLVSREASKGGRTERVVPLSSYVVGEIRTWSLPSEGFCFRRHDGHAGPNPPHLISQVANRFLHDSGIRATFHQLRHYALSQAYMASLDLRAVQEIAGHASPATTSGYCAYANQSAADAMEKIPHPGRLHAVRTGKKRSQGT